MKQLNLKKLVLLNLPYFLLGLFATNLGEAWRLATGADASAKMLSFFSTLPVALGSWWPSLHPLDLAVGICCGAGLRLAVYLKGKNAKKYRHNVEYGSARWGTHEDIHTHSCGQNNGQNDASALPPSLQPMVHHRRDIYNHISIHFRHFRYSLPLHLLWHKSVDFF